MCRHMVYAAGDVQILCITHLSLTQTVTAHETAMEMLVEFPLRVYVWIMLCIVVYTFRKYLYAKTGQLCVCVCVCVCVCALYVCAHTLHTLTQPPTQPHQQIHMLHTATSTHTSNDQQTRHHTHIKRSTNQTPHTHHAINKPDTTHTSSDQQNRHHTHIKRSTKQTPHTHQAINKTDTMQNILRQLPEIQHPLGRPWQRVLWIERWRGRGLMRPPWGFPLTRSFLGFLRGFCTVLSQSPSSPLCGQSVSLAGTHNKATHEDRASTRESAVHNNGTLSLSLSL